MNTQADFAAALLDPAAPCPAGLASWNGSDPSQRFAVYRNNVAVSLVDALADTYPVVQALVGAEFFRAMARRFALAQPPRSPVLACYGKGFGEFIAGFTPTASVPYLADVARLEMARVLSFHAADAASVSPEEIQHYLAHPESLPNLRIGLHPALHQLASQYAVASLWAAHQDGGLSIAAVDIDQPEHVLLMRREQAVELHVIAAAEHLFINRLANGATLGQAAQAALDADADFELSAALGLLIRLDAICTLTG
jgi:hypothetical protein